MNTGWKIIYYELPSGDKPVKEFINSLDIPIQVKVGRALDLLQEFNVRLGLPHVRKLSGTDLWELRIIGSDSIRIFYITLTDQNIFLIHGFKKKSQKTEKREIKVATARLQEYRLRKISGKGMA